MSTVGAWRREHPISTQGKYGHRGKAHKENLACHSKANVAYVPCTTQAPRRRHASATQAPHAPGRRLEVDLVCATGTTQAPRMHLAVTWMWTRPMPLAPRRRHTGATRAPGRHLKVDVAGATCATQTLRVRHACAYACSQVEANGPHFGER